MPRVEVCDDGCDIDFFVLLDRSNSLIPAETKPSSWGYLGGRFVAIDYGS
jgi:hypothetical protein